MSRLVVSVPWEPWFRLGNLGRGKNVARWGNDPEHVNFFNPRKLRAALGAHFAEVNHRIPNLERARSLGLVRNPWELDAIVRDAWSRHGVPSPG